MYLYLVANLGNLNLNTESSCFKETSNKLVVEFTVKFPLTISALKKMLVAGTFTPPINNLVGSVNTLAGESYAVVR